MDGKAKAAFTAVAAMLSLSAVAQDQQAPQFKQADSNRDGFVSQNEASQVRIDRDTLAQADANGDGRLSQSEYQSLGAGGLMSMKADDLKGKKVVNKDGNEIGQVQKIVQNKQDQSLAAVVSMGGVMGIGSSRVAIPLNQIQQQGDNLQYQSGETKEELKKTAAYNEADYQNVPSDQSLAAISSGGAGAAGGAATASFVQLDQNKDGYISQQEARTEPQLSQNMRQYDQNKDNRLDRSEFSAFEQQQKQSQLKGPATGAVSFQQLDTNQDGYIDMREAQNDQQLSSNLQQFDTDQDSRLDESEFSAFEQQAKAAGTGAAATFQQLDMDKDGFISQQEAQSDPQLSSNMQQFDTNKDNRLDQAEFSAFEQQQKKSGAGAGQASFRQLDQNRDGSISQQEAQSSPQLAQNWQQFDKNRDHKLDRAEFSAFDKKQKQWQSK